MGKALANKRNKIDTTNILLLLGLLIVTIVFVAIIVISLINPKTIKRIDQIEEITLSEYNKLGSEEKTEYLIFVYSSETNEYYEYSTYRNELVIGKVLEYASYVKKHSEHDHAVKIYRLDISKRQNKNAIETLKLTEESYVPAVLKMKYSNGTSTINTTKKSVEDIHNYLDSLMVEDK